MMNYTKLFLLFSVCLFSCTTPKTAKPFNEQLTAEQNIMQNAEQFSEGDMSFLARLADRQIVILGERGHTDTLTTKVKVQMVDYLSTKGFDRVAFEGYSFLSGYAYNNPEYSELFKTYWSIYTTNWCGHTTFAPLSQKITDGDIKVWGIDIYLALIDIPIAEAMLKKYSDKAPLPISWERLKYLYNSYLVEQGSKVQLTQKDKIELMEYIDKIINYANHIAETEGKTMDIRALRQWVRNVNTGFSWAHYFDEDTTKPEVELTLGVRDRQMAENILWHAENFPEEKFTVWCANFHGAKDLSQTSYKPDPLYYYVFQSMGETLYHELGDRVYSLATINCNAPAEDSIRGKLEVELIRTMEKNGGAFIDLEPLRYADGYRDMPFECEVIKRKDGKWLQIFDGIYFF